MQLKKLQIRPVNDNGIQFPTILVINGKISLATIMALIAA